LITEFHSSDFTQAMNALHDLVDALDVIESEHCGCEAMRSDCRRLPTKRAKAPKR
jgi:hypothetical protein